jgi:hypothetical protein
MPDRTFQATAIDVASFGVDNVTKGIVAVMGRNNLPNRRRCTAQLAVLRLQTKKEMMDLLTINQASM